ncbi:DUF2752 domain-containing protein [Mangrovimonas aestuarii]|uniref:DUF2752 domain-containing protein n=1 Tax=Mangrovimonas aestuarii TaxID=3018443 RepID=UPI002378585C|nr:DUF2752 domain-containing protein [Mangrovimonas aestuarii]
MLPCLNKKLLGIECLGCGLQRSVVLIFKGELINAFLMYPAIYPILGFIVFLILNSFLTFKYADKTKFILVVIIISTIVINYIIKLIN